MSITQQRMIDTINAGLDFKQALDDLIALIDKIHTEYPDHPGITHVWGLSDYSIRLKQPAKSPFILAREAAHFRANRARNARNAAKAERKRREQGVAQRDRPHQFDPVEPVAPKLRPIISDTYHGISPERQRQILAEAEASARKWHPEHFIDEAPTSATSRPADWTPEDPEDSFDLTQEIKTNENDTAGFHSTPRQSSHTGGGPALPNDSHDTRPVGDSDDRGNE